MKRETFLQNIVFGWIKKDIERILKEIPAKDGSMGNVNFPLALCILSYMETLGSFLLGEDKGITDNIEAFRNNCLVNKYEYISELLAGIFRNSLAHDYFARGGISRNGLRPAMYFENGIVILDVQTFSHDFLDSLEVFSEVLTEANYSKRMQEIFKKLQKSITTHKDSIAKLPIKQITPTLTYISTSGVSLSTYPIGDTTSNT